MINKKFINHLNDIEALTYIQINEIQEYFKKDGWFFKVKKTSGRIRLFVYELEEDFSFWNDLYFTARAETFQEAFKIFLFFLKEKNNAN